jgi:hypothetical protein
MKLGELAVRNKGNVQKKKKQKKTKLMVWKQSVRTEMVQSCTEA